MLKVRSTIAHTPDRIVRLPSPAHRPMGPVVVCVHQAVAAWIPRHRGIAAAVADAWAVTIGRSPPEGRLYCMGCGRLSPWAEGIVPNIPRRKQHCCYNSTTSHSPPFNQHILQYILYSYICSISIFAICGFTPYHQLYTNSSYQRPPVAAHRTIYNLMVFIIMYPIDKRVGSESYPPQWFLQQV